VQGAPTLTSQSLPEALKKLTSIQNYEISERFWQRDIDYLLTELDKVGLQPSAAADNLIYPARVDKSAALSDHEIASVLGAESGWSLHESKKEMHGRTTNVRELCKTYTFQSFEDCIHFMTTASRHISTIDHHPSWENVWVNLRVRLSTWDIGGSPTYKDIRLAKYLDELFIVYKKKSEA
jgi:4a-hydroxytetrahydrobiopterin dehydratase